MHLRADCATPRRCAIPTYALRLPPAQRWPVGITVGLEADGGNTVTADMDGSGHYSGHSPILTSMTMRSGATDLALRSGVMAMMTSTPACLHLTATMTLLAICHHAPRRHLAHPVQPPIGWHNCAVKIATILLAYQLI